MRRGVKTLMTVGCRVFCVFVLESEENRWLYVPKWWWGVDTATKRPFYAFLGIFVCGCFKRPTFSRVDDDGFCFSPRLGLSLYLRVLIRGLAGGGGFLWVLMIWGLRRFMIGGN